VNERPFLDKSNKPTEQNMQSALGNMFVCFKEVIDLASSYSQEWMFTKSSGWMLKIYDPKKALFYLIPLNDGFKISLAIREDEQKAFLCDDELGVMQEKISSSKKYSEGYALQFDIANKNDFQLVELFIRKLIAIRV
jgi:hypothetical protein